MPKSDEAGGGFLRRDDNISKTSGGKPSTRLPEKEIIPDILRKKNDRSPKTSSSSMANLKKGMVTRYGELEPSSAAALAPAPAPAPVVVEKIALGVDPYRIPDWMTSERSNVRSGSRSQKPSALSGRNTDRETITSKPSITEKEKRSRPIKKAEPKGVIRRFIQGLSGPGNEAIVRPRSLLIAILWLTVLVACSPLLIVPIKLAIGLQEKPDTFCYARVRLIAMGMNRS